MWEFGGHPFKFLSPQYDANAPTGQAELAEVTELSTFLFSAERAENKKHYPFG
jgi:hypothetical protein